jgi:L-seryl-tRNA(Ser) seleniumtransferase
MTEMLQQPSVLDLFAEFGEGIVKLEIRRCLDDVRGDLRKGRILAPPEVQDLAKIVRERVERFVSRPGRRALNAAGILLHTGLGRAPLCREAVEALSDLHGYSLLQVSIDTGKRSSREEKVERMLIELTGCEAATVANNNAAATMLILNTLAEGKEVIVSRGQLIEIGGSFRLPDVLVRSGALLREVGTTNRTHLRDYEEVIGESTGAIIHVHTSNYRVRGFVKTPEIRELCALGRKHGVPVIDDVGSGALVPLQEFGIHDEPLVPESMASGVHAATFSADKLICGPQAGIICGKRDVIARVKKNPFARMFRVGKLTLAALESTLVHFVNGTWRERIPLYRLLSTSLEELERRARFLAEAIGGIAEAAVRVEEDLSYMGSGSTPDEGIPTRTVCLSLGEGPEGSLAADRIARRLRRGIPSVFCRIHDEHLVFDMRTLFPGEETVLAEQIRRALLET